MGYRMKGPLFFRSPAKQYKTPTIPSVDYDNDDQSKSNARKKGNTCTKCDKLKGNCSCKKKSQEQIEDELGLDTNIKLPKVHVDGNKNTTHFHKKNK